MSEELLVDACGSCLTPEIAMHTLVRCPEVIEETRGTAEIKQEIESLFFEVLLVNKATVDTPEEKEKLLAHLRNPERKFSFMGLPFIVDDSIPLNELHFRGKDGALLARLKNLGTRTVAGGDPT